MGFATDSIPQISVSLAPPEEPLVEPYSPFSSLTPISQWDEDAFRPVHLTPPPVLTRFNKQLSPLHFHEDTVPAKGLERKRFEALLQASRERNSAPVKKEKAGDLRKEVALKAHKNKQVERRALFLSKVLAPPSPTATLTPKTPPDSPAIFHYSLPSPGLVSPLALFESLSENSSYGPLSYGCEPWIEQVDFRIVEPTKAKEPGLQDQAPHPGRPLPSLDQISARLSSQGQVWPPVPHRTSRLPAFLTSRAAIPERPKSISVGRLHMPFRATNSIPEPNSMTPKSNVRISTPAVPRSTTISSTQHPRSDLFAFDSRERRAHDMLSTLRRRTVSSDCDLSIEMDGAARKSKWKRHSAPADLLPLKERTGFEHPVLALPGGF